MSAVATSALAVQLLELEPHERRSHNRYPIKLEVEYILLNPRGHPERLGYGRTVNVSSSGILFRADDALPAGSSIKLAIKWPFLLEGRCALKLHLSGTIIRSVTKKAAVQIAHHEFRTVGLRSQGASSAKVVKRERTTALAIIVTPSRT
jgi:PilZ domain